MYPEILTQTIYLFPKILKRRGPAPVDSGPPHLKRINVGANSSMIVLHVGHLPDDYVQLGAYSSAPPNARTNEPQEANNDTHANRSCFSKDYFFICPVCR